MYPNRAKTHPNTFGGVVAFTHCSSVVHKDHNAFGSNFKLQSSASFHFHKRRKISFDFGALKRGNDRSLGKQIDSEEEIRVSDMVLGLSSFSERTGDGAGEPVLNAENGEELMHVQPGVAIVLGNQTPESPGTLYISTKRVIWLSDVHRQRGYAVDFLSLSLHAVSRDPEAYSSPCIYTQIETEAGEDEESEGSDSECHQSVDVSKITEMRLIPSDPSQLDSLFDIFCECAELNPEPVEEQEEEHNWIFSADQMEDVGVGLDGREDSEWQLSENSCNPPIGYSNGVHDLSRTVLELQIDDQRFEDAEEMERDTHSDHQ